MIFLIPALSICYPSIVILYFKLMMPFVTFDYLPPEHSTEHIFEFYEDAEPYSSALEAIGYDTSNYIKNCGSIFLILMLIVAQFVVYWLLFVINKFCLKRKYPRVNKLENYFETNLYYGRVYTLMFGAYFEFVLSGLIAFKEP
jgi:hypothetical protein